MKISYFGDSHINAVKRLDPYLAAERYQQREHNFSLNGDDIWVRFFGSASAVGLSNPNSVTGVSTAVPEYIKADLALGVRQFAFHFGKVDLDFVLPFRWLSSGIDIQTFMSKSISSYAAFLNDLRSHYFPADAEITIVGLTPPSLHAIEMLPFVKNESIMKDVLNKTDTAGDVSIPSDKSIVEAIGSRKARTELCAAYNNRLHQVAVNGGYRFVDPTPYVINENTGELLEEFIFPNDHHLNPDQLSLVLRRLTISDE